MLNFRGTGKHSILKTSENYVQFLERCNLRILVSHNSVLTNSVAANLSCQKCIHWKVSSECRRWKWHTAVVFLTMTKWGHFGVK